MPFGPVASVYNKIIQNETEIEFDVFENASMQ